MKYFCKTQTRREDSYWPEGKRVAMEDRYRDFPRLDHHFHDFDHWERGHYQEHVIDRSAPLLHLLPRVIRCGRWVLVLSEKLIASWDLHRATAGNTRQPVPNPVPTQWLCCLDCQGPLCLPEDASASWACAHTVLPLSWGLVRAVTPAPRTVCYFRSTHPCPL